MNLESLLLAIKQLQTELPGLIGDEPAQALSIPLADKLTQFQNETDKVRRQRIALEMQTLLTANPVVRTRLGQLLDGVTLFEAVLFPLVGLAPQLGAEAAVVTQLQAMANWPVDKESRFIWGNKETAVSFKWQNLSFEFGELAEFGVGIFMALSDLVSSNNNNYDLVMGGAFLLIVRGLQKMFTETIAVQEITVFMGLVQAIQNERWVELEVIQQYTNQLRQTRELSPLKEEEVRRSLLLLEELGSVKKVVGNHITWRVVEKYYFQAGV